MSSSTNANSSKNQDNQQNVEQKNSSQTSDQTNPVQNLTAIISLKSLLTKVVPSDKILVNEECFRDNLTNKGYQNLSKIYTHSYQNHSDPNVSKSLEIQEAVTSQAAPEVVEDNLTRSNTEANPLDRDHICINQENLIWNCATELKGISPKNRTHENITEQNGLILNTDNALKQYSNTTIILKECDSSWISIENRRVLSQNNIHCNISQNVRTSPKETEQQNASNATSPATLHESNPQNPVIVSVHHVQAQATPQSFSNSISPFEQESEIEITITPSPVSPKVIYGPPPLVGAPPSYSAVMRLGSFIEILPPPIPRRREVQIQPSPPFIAPIPPPTYAEAEGVYMENAVASGNMLSV